METTYLNTTLESLAQTLQNTMQVEMKRKYFDGKELYHPKKEYIIEVEVNGELVGYLSLAFEKDTALKMVSRLMGGMETSGEMDDMAKSALQEMGGMIQSAVLTALTDADYACEVEAPRFQTKEEVGVKPSEFLLHLLCDSDVGELEINIQLNK